MPLRWVKTAPGELEGATRALEGENDVTDLRACLFVDGTLSKVYDAPTSVDGGYGIRSTTMPERSTWWPIPRGLLDLNALQERSISESKWLELSVGMKDAAPARFFSRKLQLDGLENSQTELPVTLKRGVARFDLQAPHTAGVASVSSITLKNAAQSAYLFRSRGDLSPADVTRQDAVATISEPLTKAAGRTVRLRAGERRSGDRCRGGDRRGRRRRCARRWIVRWA